MQTPWARLKQEAAEAADALEASIVGPAVAAALQPFVNATIAVAVLALLVWGLRR
jgi:hypothetical protein